MATYIVLAVHHNDAKHVCKVREYDSPTTLVETLQRNLRKLGQPDGVTWKVYEGSLLGALVATQL